MKLIKKFESYTSNESNLLKEHGETSNYMFFGNLKTIKRLVDEMLEMDEAKVDAILLDGHNWAVDHIATSKDDIEEVFNFLAGHNIDHEHETHDNDMMSGDDSEEVGCGCCDECNGQEDCECCDECTCNQSVINKDDGYPVNLSPSVIKSFQNFK
jgi:TATA-binding protein-associated factor Taf7